MVTARWAAPSLHRRTQQHTTGHRGRTGDPLYRIRRILLTAVDRLDARGWHRLAAGLRAGDPDGHVAAAWQTTYEISGTPALEQVIDPSSALADEDYYDILSEWGDSEGRSLLIRQGRYDHLSINHGLTLSTVQKVTQRENRVSDGGTRYLYQTIARLYTCSTFPWPECTITAEQPILVVMTPIQRLIAESLEW